MKPSMGSLVILMFCCRMKSASLLRNLSSCLLSVGLCDGFRGLMLILTLSISSNSSESSSFAFFFYNVTMTSYM